MFAPVKPVWCMKKGRRKRKCYQSLFTTTAALSDVCRPEHLFYSETGRNMTDMKRKHVTNTFLQLEWAVWLKTTCDDADKKRGRLESVSNGCVAVAPVSNASRFPLCSQCEWNVRPSRPHGAPAFSKKKKKEKRTAHPDSPQQHASTSRNQSWRF